jgi:hypothetical protein
MVFIKKEYLVIRQLIIVLISVTLTFCNLYSQSDPAKSVKAAATFIDFNGDNKEDLINVQAVSGKMFADGISFNGSGFSILQMADSQGDMLASMKWFTGDFNGDGKTDIAKLWDDNGKISCDVHLSDGTKFTKENWIVQQGDFSYSYRWLTGDFNADGKTDIAKIIKSNNQVSIDVYCSAGNGFDLKSWIINAGTWNNNFPFLVGDFTGDGATDIARFRETSFDIFAADPVLKVFSYKDWGTSSLSFDKSHRLFTGDFNGDLKTDVAKIWISNGKANIDVFFSDGTTLSGRRVTTETGINSYGMKWFPGDFSGDGKTDFVKIYNEAGNLKIDVYASGADTFTPVTWLDIPGSFKDTQRWFAGDYNGDGKTDLAAFSIEKGTQYLDWYEAGNGLFIPHKGVLNYTAKIDRALGKRIYTHKYIDPSWIQGPVPPDITNVRIAMENGQDVWLARGETYYRLLDGDNLNMSANQQIISTFDPIYIKDFATIKMVDMPPKYCVNTRQVNYTLIENFICDGNRYGFDAAIDGNTDKFVSSASLISAGTTSGQRIKRVIVLNSRGQSAIKLQEGNSAEDNWVENCIVFGAGVDPRGSGRNLTYNKGWADAMGVSSTKSQVRENLVIDGTDVGIVLFTTPGSLVEHNVVATISRETLGAINLVDFLSMYLKEQKDGISYYNYNVTVRNNYIDAFGARFHNGIPTGDGIWGESSNPVRYGIGQTIRGNILNGDCFGYGIAVRTGKDMTITDNLSYAKHTGTANGWSYNDPDPATDFITEKYRLMNSVLQPDFKEAQLYITHLLWMNHAPKRPIGHSEEGYKYWEYTNSEANGIVTAAFIEMLRRMPTTAELTSYSADLIAGQYPADAVRRKLMKTDEFILRNGVISDDGLHPYRTELWMNNFREIDKAYIDSTGNLPSALHLYNRVLSNLSGTEIERFKKTITAIPDNIHLENDLITCYPNPFKSKIKISSKKVINSISVMSLSKLEVIEKKIFNTSADLDLSELPDGFYIVHVLMFDGTAANCKIIKN